MATQRSDETRADIAAVVEELRHLDERQLTAVMVFAIHLRIGGVHPLFFSQLADALEDRGASE